MNEETIGTATYSPEDNKLRLYPFVRLPKELYERVRAQGFIWAPKQELFVAPKWTPSREDFLLELCGEIEDEDKSLVDRAEERSERFENYSEKRATEADRTQKGVEAITEHIPMGQPILAGHHSEKRARRDAEKIENGIRKAVRLWETSEYWTRRAAGAIRNAKYKELPNVRARRIKTLEADKRAHERNKADAERWLRAWGRVLDDSIMKHADGTPSTALERARSLANYCHLNVITEGQHTFSAYDVLQPDGERFMACPAWTPEQVQTVALELYPRIIENHNRWLAHIENRLTYERAMLTESGGTASDQVKPEVGGACVCWTMRDAWSYIQKVNKVSVTVLDNWGNGGANFTRTLPFDKLQKVMSAAEISQKRNEGLLVETADKRGFFLKNQETKPTRTPEPDTEKHLDTLREALKQGIQVVSAPQLFPTPPELAERMIEEANLQAGQGELSVLEPSVGTGNIIQAIWNPEARITAVEINSTLVAALGQRFNAVKIHCADFLSLNGELGTFDRIVMNPPFENASDIKHILHALTMLKDGGRLVAICANGSRQKDKLKPLCSTWEDLPPDTFKESGTGVSTALIVIDK